MADIFETMRADLAGPDGYLAVVMVPLIAAGFGAFFGAKLAACFAMKAQQRKADTEQLNTLSVAVTIAAAVCNDAIGLKRQQLKPLCSEYSSNRDTVVRELGLPTVQKELHVNFNLQALQVPTSSAADLLELINREAIGGGLTRHAFALNGSAENVRKLIVERNEWITRFESNKDKVEKQVQMYFGIQSEGQVVDTRYFDLMTNLQYASEDSIFHAYMLHTQLTKNLIDAFAKYRVKYKRIPFDLVLVDFKQLGKEEFLPDMSAYREWFEPSERIVKPKFKTWKKYYGELRDRFDVKYDP